MQPFSKEGSRSVASDGGLVRFDVVEGEESDADGGTGTANGFPENTQTLSKLKDAGTGILEGPLLQIQSVVVVIIPVVHLWPAIGA